jgi:arsenite-transporting ATPase
VRASCSRLAGACTSQALTLSPLSRSDAFGQKFSGVPTLVEGFTNLYCMEIDPSVEADVGPDLGAGGADGGGGVEAGMKGFMKEFAGQIPGIDELMSFAELMKAVQRMDFDVTVFDTAPTGHTLRLLAMPTNLDALLGKVLGFRSTIGPLMTASKAMMGGAAGEMPSEEQLFAKLDELKSTVDAVQARIHAADETTFVCVCIPEFLSLYETERLVQELSKFDIDTHNIVVNQVLFEGHDNSGSCSRCAARMRMQAKYMDQISDLYEDFHVIKTPLLNDEVRGAKKLTAFGSFLLSPYDPREPLPAELTGAAR